MAILRGCLGSRRNIDSLSKATCDLRSGENFVKYLVMLVSERAKHGIDLTRLLVFSFQRLRLHDDDLSLPQSIAIFEKEVGTYISNRKKILSLRKSKRKLFEGEGKHIYITYLHAFALGQANPRLLLSDNKHVAFPRCKRVINHVFDMHNVEASVMSFPMGDDTHPTHIAPTGSHGDGSCVKVDEVGDFAR